MIISAFPINRNCEPQTGNFTDSAARLHHQVCRVVSVYSFTCHITVKHGPSPAGREKVKACSLHPTSLLTSLKNYTVCKHFILSLLSCLFWLTGEMIILLGKLHPHSQFPATKESRLWVNYSNECFSDGPKPVWHSDISLYKPALHSLQYHLTVLWLYVAFNLFLFQCNYKPGLGN